MLYAFEGHLPVVEETVMISPSASVVGDVVLGEGSSVWYNAVVRGDVAPVRIGKNTSIQDGVVVHTAGAGVNGTGSGERPTVVGDFVTVGHNAVLHACTVEDCCLIGMGAILLDGCVIGKGSVIAAGAVVTGRSVIPPLSLVTGVPGHVVKTLPEESLEARRAHALHYRELAQKYR